MSNVITNRNKHEVANLGDGGVFIKRTENGTIKAVKGNIMLEERKGHIADIQGKAMITAAGYNEMNKIAGVSIITPEKLTLPDGQIVVNPYPIIDRESGTISKVWVKKMAIGYSPIGNIVITSSTLLYDITMYFVQDLVNKVQYNKNAGKLCMEQFLTEEEKKTGIFLKIEGSLGVWANIQDKDVIKAMNTYIQNKLFAERKAQTICERNVLKKHPALSTVYADAQGPDKAKLARVPVIGFTHDLTKDDLMRLSNMAENGEEIGPFKGREVEIYESIDEIDDEDIISARDEEEVIEEDIPEMNKQTTVATKISEDTTSIIEEKKTALAFLKQAELLIGEAEFNNLMLKNFNKPAEALNLNQLRMAKKLVNEFIDDMGGAF